MKNPRNLNRIQIKMRFEIKRNEIKKRLREKIISDNDGEGPDLIGGLKEKKQRFMYENK